MEGWEGPRLLAQALGHDTVQGVSIIADVLSYLGISQYYSRGGDGTRTKESSLAMTISDEISHIYLTARFEWESKTWDIPRPSRFANDRSAESSKVASPKSGHSPAHERFEDEIRRFEKLSVKSFAMPIIRVWTDVLPNTKHVEFLKSRDWSATSLGPMRDWPTPLRLMTLKIMSDPCSVNLYWGNEYISIYNESFVILASSRHPAMMGATVEAALPVTWKLLHPIFKEVQRSRSAYSVPEMEMMVEKTVGFLEEAWYDIAFSPILGEDGKCLGLYNTGYDITHRVLAGRRSRLLHQISASHATDEDPWQQITDACLTADKDIPFLLTYSASGNNTAKSQKCSLLRRGIMGLQEGHLAAPTSVELHEGNDGFIPAMRLARARKRVVILEALPEGFEEGVEWRGHGVPVTVVAVVPLFVLGQIAGFLVVGLNPRLPYDEPHERFVEELSRVTVTLLSATISADQARTQALKISKELTASEKFLRSVAEVASVGLYNLSNEGLLTWANTRFYTITGVSECPESTYNWAGLHCLLEEDKEVAAEAIKRCMESQLPTTYEVRLNKEWQPHGSGKESCWTWNSVTPVIENGQTTSVLGCITDISNLKWAERIQYNIAESAKEAKRQQEKFMDITSHEMRNPLSAILQCADDICQLYHDSPWLQSVDQSVSDNFDRVLENAETILFCAEHQKRIIDDILTVSKLDSSMLHLAPTCINAAVIAKQALYMFERELIATETKYSFAVKKTYTDLDVDFVFCDASRLSQVLINLMTSAIKFTKLEKKREIHMRLGASVDRPPQGIDGLKWYPSARAKAKDDGVENKKTVDADKEIYLTFEVQDTGKGISSEEMLLLFNRFSQASPLTHVKYGGSGLGLFICREFIELQGGLIGTYSIPGQGSTFAFFIKTKKIAVDPSFSRPTISHQRSRSYQPLYTQATPPRMNSAPTIPQIAEAIKNHQSTEVPPTPPHDRPVTSPPSPISILLVEDNLVNQKVLSKQLQRLGYVVHIANHGMEALDFIETTRFWRANDDAGESIDCVLMDWEMPVMDGLACTRAIREWEKQGLLTVHLPIIATTANTRQEQVQEALDAGMDDLIAKPFKAPAVVERMKKFIAS